MTKTTAAKAASNTAAIGQLTGDDQMDKPIVISPTVGRRVHFYPNAEHAEALGVFDGQQPCDAGVIYVWGDRSVNLDVTGPSGARVALQNVRLLQGDEQPEESESYAAWMTYQIKKAAEEAAT